ncbi:MAG: 1-phosphofructokinase family hexose kinase [Kouleothrix sp.]|nr:1-phosphofructokinase family hexose kinase [Kouleothrix sp.]
MILCLNANAAIDKTVVVSPFRLNAIHRPRQVLAAPGGKGANVARGLQRLGETAVVAGWVGGFSGQFIEAGLRREGIATALVQVDGESRTCLSILDPEQNTLTEIYERGEPIAPAQVDQLKALLQSTVAQYAAVTLSGSLPPGVPSSFYGELLEIARAAGVPGFLDSGGEALRRGLEIGRPRLIKPNAHEFAELVGRKLDRPAEIAQAAVELSTRHQTIVAVSLGADGILAADRSEVVRLRPPRLAIQSAVGSGDCTLAGIVYGLTRGLSLEQALRYGVAAGTANALTVGAGYFELGDFERVLAQVAPVDVVS